MKRFAIVMSLLAFAIPASAASVTWTGNAGTNLMSDPANWDGNAVPTDGDTVIFPANKYGTIENDLAEDTVFQLLVIGSSYELTGNRFGLYDGIEVTSTGSVIRNDIFLAEPQAWSLPLKKTMNLYGQIDMAEQPLTLNVGTEGLGAAMTFNGPIVGNGEITLESGSIRFLAPVEGSLTIDQGDAWMDGGELTGDLTATNGHAWVELSNMTMQNFSVANGMVRHTGGTVSCTSLTATEQVTFNMLLPFGTFAVSGPADLGGAQLISDNPSPVWSAAKDAAIGNSATDVVVIDNDGTDPIVGTFKDLPEGGLLTADPDSFTYKVFRITYVGGDGNDVVLHPLRLSEIRLTSSAEPYSIQGQTVTFTATMNPPWATGDLVVQLDGVVVGTIPIVNGVATYSTSTLTVGRHTLRVDYPGEQEIGRAFQQLLHLVVGPGTPTQIYMAFPDDAYVGADVKAIATVSPAIPMTGLMEFSLDDTVIATLPLVNREVMLTFNTGNLSVGPHTFIARYLGDATSAPSSVSRTLTIRPLQATVVTVNVTPSPSQAGESVTITAELTPPVYMSSAVAFLVDGIAIATVPIVNGYPVNRATLTTSSIPAGTHTITAQYGGGDRTAPASASVSHVVQSPQSAIATSTQLNVNPGFIVGDEPLTLSVHVSSSDGIPQGSVVFYDGADIYQIVPLDSAGNATTTIVFRDSPHTLKAAYSGSATHAASTSAEIVVSTPPRRRRAVR